MNEPVRTSRNGAVLEITLDRPKANAIDAATSRTMYDVFHAFQNDPALTVAIVTGVGRFFSAGWDLKAVASGEEAGASHGSGGFAGITEYFDLDKPVIAAVNGIAFGGGFELALACDLIVAADSAEFALPEVTVGVIASSGGIQRLPTLLPPAIAMEMLMTGRRMAADEALRWGLVNRVAPDAMTAARELAAVIAANAPLSLRASKALVRKGAHLGARGAFALMYGGTVQAHEQWLTSDDAKEGPQAFAEKRAPRWTGR